MPLKFSNSLSSEFCRDMDSDITNGFENTFKKRMQNNHQVDYFKCKIANSFALCISNVK